MSLSTNVTNLATRIGTESKALRTLVNGNAADLSALTTTTKTDLVAALNELKALIGTAGAQINDAATNSAETWSSSKINTQITSAISALTTGAPAALDTLDELAAALGDDANAAATITTALGNRVRADASQSFTGPQQAQARTNIDAASATDVGSTTANYVTTFEAALV